jgi:ketosteroid isomerase-like protein
MTNEEEILKLFEDGDRALVASDVAELQRIYADDYVQCDETGKAFTRKDLIENLTSGKIRFTSMKSTSRRIRVLQNDAAIVHGSEEDEIERAGERFLVRYIYMDVVMKRNGRWQIVASQLARVAQVDPRR